MQQVINKLVVIKQITCKLVSQDLVLLDCFESLSSDEPLVR